MSHPNAVTSRSSERSDWKDAPAAVLRLTTPKTDVQRIDATPVNAADANGTAVLTINLLTAAGEGAGIKPGLTEIEQAAATLRRLEPQLEIWLPDMAPAGEPQPPYSVWALIGSIWISTVSVVAGSVGVVMYLCG